MFITLEGPEGSGKTSHIPHLVEYLREMGYTVFPTREPGGTSISEYKSDIFLNLRYFLNKISQERLKYRALKNLS